MRYVLEGSVQRDQNRVRVNAQLIDAEIRRASLGRPFRGGRRRPVQAAGSGGGAIGQRVGHRTRQGGSGKGARSKNPDAIDLTMRGWALARPSQQTKEKNEAARALFEQALKIDPNNADALAGSAYTYANEFVAWRNPGTDYDAKILGQADRAIALAPDALWAYYVKCVYLFYSHRAAKAIDAANAGLAINPNFANLLGVRGVANLFDGRFEQTMSDILQSQRLSPRDPLKAISTSIWAMRNLALGISPPRSTTTTKRSTSACTICGLTRAYRRVCTRGRDGRSQSRPCGTAPPQAQSHDQVRRSVRAANSEPVRRPAQGGPARGVSAPFIVRAPRRRSVPDIRMVGEQPAADRQTRADLASAGGHSWPISCQRTTEAARATRPAPPPAADGRRRAASQGARSASPLSSPARC